MNRASSKGFENGLFVRLQHAVRTLSMHCRTTRQSPPSRKKNLISLRSYGYRDPADGEQYGTPQCPLTPHRVTTPAAPPTARWNVRGRAAYILGGAASRPRGSP